MALVCTLAWRYLWRNKRRSIIMLATLTLGAWAMIFSLALMRGMTNGIVENGIEALPGHVQAHHNKYLDDPSIVNSFPQLNSSQVHQLEANTNLTWAQRLKLPAVVSSERESRSIVLWAVEPVRENDFSFSSFQVVQGQALQSADQPGVIIGEKLLKRLKTALGRRVVIMSQDEENNIADVGVRVIGVFRSNLPGMEESRIYMGLGAVQKFIGAEGLVSELSVNGRDYLKTETSQAAVQAVMSDSQETLEVLSWRQINTYLDSMLKVMDGFVLVWVSIIFLALSFGLVNTLTMAVFERVREIGLMQALGLRPKMMLYQVVVEACMLVVLGLILGNFIAWLCILPFNQGMDLSSVAEGMEMMGASSTIHPLLLKKDLIFANSTVFVLSIVASLIPAWRASRYTPVLALNKTY